MVSKLVKLHILSHALEYYVKREGASQKDIRQELAVLNEIEKELEDHKNEKIGSIE